MTELISIIFLTTHLLLIIVITTVYSWTPSSQPKFLVKYGELIAELLYERAQSFISFLFINSRRKTVNIFR